VKRDYVGVNARIWALFMAVHGSDRVICRSELDIYDGTDVAPDLFVQELADLFPDELRECSRSSSVDESKKQSLIP